MNSDFNKYVDSFVTRLIKWFFFVIVARGLIYLVALSTLYFILKSFQH